MRNALLIVICAATVAMAPSAALSLSSKSNVQASTDTSVTVNKHRAGLKARADTRRHTIRTHSSTRLHGANNPNFCPPGQAKKPGLGSRFQC